MAAKDRGKSPIQRGGSNSLRRACHRIIREKTSKPSELVIAAQILAYFEGYPISGKQIKAVCAEKSGPTASSLKHLTQDVETEKDRKEVKEQTTEGEEPAFQDQAA